MIKETIILLLYNSEADTRQARMVIESLRAFGGRLSASPVWIFSLDPEPAIDNLPGPNGVHYYPLIPPETHRHYPFAAKVATCAQAEAQAGPDVGSLVWLSLDTLVVNPPLLFDLDPEAGVAPAAVASRPVHHRNVGSIAAEPPDPFWQAVYRALAMEQAPYTVRSFADGLILRPYFNTHCFAFNPTLGLGRAWWQHFHTLVADEPFQAGPCRGQLHRIFLHQAILSTLVAKMVPWERVRLLPPTYNYPLNLLNELPHDGRVPELNRLVTSVYEDTFPWHEIVIREPLRSWLLARMPGAQESL